MTTSAGRADLGLVQVVPEVPSMGRASPVDPEVVVAGQADRTATKARRPTAIGMALVRDRAEMAVALLPTGHVSEARSTAPIRK